MLSQIAVDFNFPGANGKVLSQNEFEIIISPQLRDTSGSWFYWAFRARGKVGQRVRFILQLESDPNYPLLSTRGPGVKVGANGTWHYLHARDEYTNYFEYTFSSADEVYFSNTFVYTDCDWQRFLNQSKLGQNLRIENLGFTGENRPVKLYRFGSPDSPSRALLTCRMHCCESIASFVLEGILARSAQDYYLQNMVEYAVVPFMDVDGSENGDQGKNRRPYDHNRDFTDFPIHAEVKLLTQCRQLWMDGKLKLGLDLHNPMLASRGDEHIHWVEEELTHIRAGQYRFANLLESNQHSNLKFAFNRISHYGVGHNQKSRPTASAWMSKLPGMQMAMSLETPYADADFCEVNIDSATRFGADIADAIKQFLLMASPQH